MCASQDTYDLVAEPWIPVTLANGTADRVGLAALVRQADSLRAFAGPPPVRICVLRLVVAILRDSLGHAGIEPGQWRRWWDAGHLPVNQVTDYLSRHAARFDLFGAQHPFLQDGAMRGDRTAVKSVAELMPHLPTGNNAMLFHRNTDLGGTNPARLSPADAACWLISLHAHTRPGITPSLNAAPPGRASGRGGLLVGRLAAVPEAQTVARTLLLNLPCAARDPGDVPGYLAREPVRPGADARGPAGLLSWTSRHVLLLPEPDGTVEAVKIAVDNAVDPLVPRDVQAAHDPHVLATMTDKAVDGWALAGAKSGRTPLGDAAVLIRHAAAPNPGSVLPQATAAARHDPVQITVYGLAVEATSKYTDWSAYNIAWADPSSIALVVEPAKIAADAAARAAASIASAAGSGSDTATARTARRRECATTAVWHLLDAPGRALLGRLAQRPMTDEEQAQWRSLCAQAARTAVAQTPYMYKHAAIAAHARGQLEKALVFARTTAGKSVA